MIDFTNLPFEEAIAYFRQKVNLPTESWQDIWEGMHSRAFVVAGATKDQLLADLRGAVDKAISQGTDISTFKKDFRQTVAKHGWNYRGEEGWRMSIILDTNLSVAYSAGRYKELTDPDILKVFPYWRYITAGDSRVRPQHAAWNGVTLKHDHPWWNDHFPPKGWRCRCRVESMSVKEYADYKGQKSAPDDGTVEYKKKNGEVISVPKGVDPGWAYNPGKAAWGENWAKEVGSRGAYNEVDAWRKEAYPWLPKKLTPETPPVPLGPALHDEAALRAGIPEGIYTDKLGQPVNVTQAIADHILEDPKNRWNGREQYFPLIPDVLQNPAEVWFGFIKYDDGKYAIRRRYVKAYQTVDGKYAAGILADTIDNQVVTVNMIHSHDPIGGRLRSGRLAYPWKEE